MLNLYPQMVSNIGALLAHFVVVQLIILIHPHSTAAGVFFAAAVSLVVAGINLVHTFWGMLTLLF